MNKHFRTTKPQDVSQVELLSVDELYLVLGGNLAPRRPLPAKYLLPIILPSQTWNTRAIMEADDRRKSAPPTAAPGLLEGMPQTVPDKPPPPPDKDF
jgi:hypothetical protein